VHPVRRSRARVRERPRADERVLSRYADMKAHLLRRIAAQSSASGRAAISRPYASRFEMATITASVSTAGRTSVSEK